MSIAISTGLSGLPAYQHALDLNRTISRMPALQASQLSR